MTRIALSIAFAILLAGLAALYFYRGRDATPTPPSDPGTDMAQERIAERRRMVDEQLRPRGIDDERLLAAMMSVPRHRFVPPEWQGQAYEDGPLPIGHDQTISQPYVVAFMTDALQLDGTQRVLEIGTGSGYQAAVLGAMAKDVYTIEIVEPLARRARQELTALGYDNVQVRIGDGYRGWPEKGPFDAIMVTAAPDHVPEPLVEQLAVGGRLVLPVGDVEQTLVLLERTPAGIQRSEILPVRFVPMTGEAEEEH